MTNSEEWYGKMADNENSILKESYGNMTLSSSGRQVGQRKFEHNACDGIREQCPSSQRIHIASRKPFRWTVH